MDEEVSQSKEKKKTKMRKGSEDNTRKKSIEVKKKDVKTKNNLSSE